MTDRDLNLEDVGYDADFEAQRAALPGAFVPARIAIAHGESYIAWTRRGPCKAMLVGRRIAAWRDAADRPQVGDWIAGTYSDSADSLLIEHLLARRTCLVRQAAGETAAAQVIAANVDVVGIVSAFAQETDDATDDASAGRLINENEGRLRRYLAAVEQSRARPLLIINKSDLTSDPAAIAGTLGVSFPGVPVIVMSGVSGVGLDALGPWLGRGKTLGLIGMSGVGKSTLVNALLGRAAQRIGEVRDGDAGGRHTTTHRELFLLENGALLIDTPGMREFGLWEAESMTGFDDVVAILTGCRFTDCRHATEPGCVLHGALKSGALQPERWASYQRQEQAVERQRGRGRAPTSAGGGHRRKPSPARHR